MKKITLDVEDNKFHYFMELIKGLDFVKVADKDADDNKEAVLANLKKGVQEVKLYKQGKLKTTSAQAFLNEL